MATRIEKMYEDIKTELLPIANLYYDGDYHLSFIHYILKLMFDLSDDLANDAITDGGQDNGIDAILIDSNVVNFFQFKFPTSVSNIANGVSMDEVDKLYNGFDIFTDNDVRFNSITWNDKLLEKRKEYKNEDRFEFKLWIVRYTSTQVDENICKKMDSYINDYKGKTGNHLDCQFYLAQNCISLFEKNMKGKWPSFKIHYNYCSSPFTDERIQIYHTFVSLKDIYDTFHNIQDQIYDGNVRFLDPNSKINEKIAETIINDRTNFHILNNGITVVCCSCNNNTSKSIISVNEGSIINGAQTVGTIIKTLNNLNLEDYIDSFVLVRIMCYERDNLLTSKITYSLNTQNTMKNSYLISNDPIIIKLQKDINTSSKYFLQIKNNEYNFLKDTDPNFTKESKNLIRIENMIQCFTAFYNICDLAYLSKNSMATLFNRDNIEEIINHIDAKKAIRSYELYLKIMNIVLEYRKYTRDDTKTNILNLLSIKDENINDYRFLNTGNYIVLFALGIYERNTRKNSEDNLIYIIKELSCYFKDKENLTNLTRSKETFSDIEQLVLLLK